MIIRKPITATKDRHNRYATWLHFEGGQRLKFYMRGAIAWPEADREGFAMMAGLNIADGIILIFEQFRFWTIKHWLNPDGAVRQREDDPDQYHLGLIQFIQDNEALYKCASYFHGGQHVDVHTRHRRELYRQKMLTQHIELIEVPYVSEVGDDLILEKLQLRAYKGDHDSFLAKSIEQWIKIRAAGTGDNNQVHALRALLAGFEYLPWREMKRNVA